MIPYGFTKESSTSRAVGFPIRGSRYMSVRKLFGISKTSFDANLGDGSNSFAPGVTQTPDINHQFFWMIRIHAPYAQGGSANVYRIRVWITYYAEFFERVYPMPYSTGGGL